MGLSGPGQSRLLRRAAILNGQSCMVVGRGGVAPVPLRGASLCWGRRVTFHVQWWAGICQDRWVHFARQYIALPRPWLPLRMESSVSRDLCTHMSRTWGSSGSSTPVCVSGPGLCGGGGVVGAEEGVGASEHPGVGLSVVVGDGEGLVAVVHEDHVRGGGRLAVGGGRDVGMDVVPEVAQGGHAVDPRPPSPCHGVGWVGAGRVVGHGGLVFADVAHRGHTLGLGISDKVPPPVERGHPDAVSWGGQAFAVGGGEQEALVSGDVEEGVEEEVLVALAQGGRLHEGGCPEGLGGARRAERQHLLVPVHSLEVLLYRRGFVEDEGGGSFAPVRQLVVLRVGRAAGWAGGEIGCRCCSRALVKQCILVVAGREVRGPARRRGAGAVGDSGCLSVASWYSGPGGGGAGSFGCACCVGWASLCLAGPFGRCVRASGGSCGPWLAVVLRWEIAAWDLGWDCGSPAAGGCWWVVLAGRGCGWVGGVGVCCVDWASGHLPGPCRLCVCASGVSCGPWLALVSRWEMAASASG